MANVRSPSSLVAQELLIHEQAIKENVEKPFLHDGILPRARPSIQAARTGSQGNDPEMHARGMPAGLLLLGVFATAAADAGSQERLERTWTFPAAQFADVEVKLVRGDVVVRRSDDSQVRVRITVSGESNVTLDPVVQEGQSGNALRLVALYPGTWRRSVAECLPSASEHGDFWSVRDSVDVELQVPLRMNVSLHTLRGSIELTALEGLLKASTNDGVLAIEASDGRPLVTANGSITFTKDARRGSGPVGSKLAVYDGNVQVWAKHGESVTVDGRSLLSPTTNLEIARSEGSETQAVTVGEPAEGTMLVELSRGSVNLSRWNPLRASALSDR